MRRLHVTTPELVPLEFRIAGGAERGLAWVVDEIVILMAMIALSCVAGVIGALTMGIGTLPAIGLVIIGRFALNLGYRWWAETRWRGQTYGKKLLSLRTVQRNGTPPLAWQAFVRNAVRPVDALPIGSLLGAVLIAVDPQGRRVGDFLAGTIVIREVRHQIPRAVRLLAREAAVLAEFVAAAPRIETSRRLGIAERLAGHYRTKLGLEAHRALPDEALLRGIVGVAYRDRFGTPVGAGSRTGAGAR